jgi:hypothetical protein
MIEVRVDTLYCKACDSHKIFSEFHKDSTAIRGYAYYCKVCATAKSRKWHSENKDSPYYKEARRGSYFKTKYDLSLDDRRSMLQSQQYSCAICLTSLSEEGKLTHIDHCHATGKIRGLLCTNCNRGLGSFKDNTLFLQEAIKYLERNK